MNFLLHPIHVIIFRLHLSYTFICRQINSVLSLKDSLEKVLPHPSQWYGSLDFDRLFFLFVFLVDDMVLHFGFAVERCV